MTSKPLLTLAIASLSILSHAATAAIEYPATLESHAILPAKTFIAAPFDAPEDLKVSGKYTTGQYVSEVGSVEGKSYNRLTGVSLPFNGQPVQGSSGIKYMDDGTYWVLTDNGYGSKANSPDAMLFIRQYNIDWNTGTFKPIKTIFFNDVNHVMKHRIVHEGTDKRYLTGADFDLESFQFIDGDIWIGEEFGPWLLQFDSTGKLKSVHDTVVNGDIKRSPDHPALKLPGAPDGDTPTYETKRSKGFEGMASSSNGRYLYPLLEGAIYDHEAKAYESVNGQNYLRILEFDTKRKQYTGKSWKYILDSNEYAIGDFNMIDDTYGLIIERDNLEGTSDRACSNNAQDTTKCFENPADYKRVYKVALDQNSDIARKVAYIDLMSIEDPKKVSKKPLVNGKLTFPFFTIENVDIVDSSHIVVGNDNNLPFSSSRLPNQADDNELVLLEVKDFLAAK